MSDEQKNIVNENGEYWKKMDELFALEEKRRIIEAIKMSDTEKFYLFTRMIRLYNTFKKIKVTDK